MKTKLIKLNDNEYRVQDIVKVNDKITIDYSDDFNHTESLKWSKIEVDEFVHFGIKPITIWNRRNYLDFNGWSSVDPLDNFDNGPYYQMSENTYVNLIMNLHKLNIIDNNIIISFQKWGNRDYLNKDEINKHYAKNGTVLVHILTYGFSNKLIAEVNPKYMSWKENKLSYEPTNVYSDVQKLIINS